MGLTNIEKRAIRWQVAAYLHDMQTNKFVQQGKPDAQEYYQFIAQRLIKKLRLEAPTKADDDTVEVKEPVNV